MMREHNADRTTPARRWEDFRRRADYGPETVYRHRARGWEYIPIHPFGDEPEVLQRLGLVPEDCRTADAWWGIDGDATLLEVRVGSPGELLARPTSHEEGWVYLTAVLDVPYVTRAAFEGAMGRFADAGFPRDPRFRLRDGDPPLPVAPSPTSG